MKTVYRYEINQAINDVNLPVGAKVLSVGVAENVISCNVISLWALVDSDAGTETRRFLVFGTGADMSATETYNLDFIGTIQKSNAYAFHIFEVK